MRARRRDSVTSARRVAAEPELPTIAESGLPGYEAVQWHGMLASAKTPVIIVERLQKEVSSVLNRPAIHA